MKSQIAPWIVILVVVLGSPRGSQTGEKEPGRADHAVNRWVRRSPAEGKPAPNFPYEGSGVYDTRRRKWIHHGGHDGIPQGFHTFTFDLDSGEWKQRFPPTSPPGACCVDGSNAYDASSGKLVRFPGGSLGHGYQWSRGVHLKESAVWLYDLSIDTWTNMRPPPYRLPEKYSRDVVGGLCSGATYDPVHELVLTFGGQGAGGGKNALFAYDSHANALHQLRAENPPPERDGMGIAYDTRRDRLVVFGGQYLTDARTWLYDLRTNRWEAHDLEPHPPAAKVTEHYSTIPRMAYDSIHGVILCVAWLGEEAHETWTLDVGEMRWTKMSPEAEPEGSKSRSRNLSFDEERNVFILETSSAKTNRPEIWTYRYRDAGQNRRPAPPTELEVITESGGRALLIWKGATPGGKYHVHRTIEGEPWRAEFTRIGTATGTRFEDQGLETGGTYVYRVTAVSETGEESASVRARTRPGVLPAPVVSVTAHGRSWSPGVPAPRETSWATTSTAASRACVR
jgi:hypothetical protein